MNNSNNNCNASLFFNPRSYAAANTLPNLASSFSSFSGQTTEQMIHNFKSMPMGIAGGLFDFPFNPSFNASHPTTNDLINLLNARNNNNLTFNPLFAPPITIPSIPTIPVPPPVPPPSLPPEIDPDELLPPPPPPEIPKGIRVRFDSSASSDNEFDISNQLNTVMNNRRKLIPPKKRSPSVKLADELMKKTLKPYYRKKKITKEEYKMIMKGGVTKLKTRKALNPKKVEHFVRKYVNSILSRR